jgi:transcriptional regulator with PAS, ATPase and Fis domain
MTDCGILKYGKVEPTECLLSHKKGHALSVTKNARVIKNRQNKIIGIVEAVTDLTELKNARMKMEEATRRLGELNRLGGIIAKSKVMQNVFTFIKASAASDATILIQGESGTGKELVAKAIHQLSPRKNGTFVAVHCAALSQNLLESELFGQEKGAFTGAMERRIGRFEKADGGSLFLDEISEIDLAIQVKLLRALEERQVERVGGDTPVHFDTRLIAATNKDLQKQVEKGEFREDLFYRLNVVVIDLPPLRERETDIPLLLSHYLAFFNQENGKEIQGYTADALDLLSRYNWPGNIRELRNVVERMVVLSRNKLLDRADVPANIREKTEGIKVDLNADLTVDEMERRMILRALEKTKGNRTKAAEKLGISRRTLHRKINEYNLS